jgi:hypothetical protein
MKRFPQQNLNNGVRREHDSRALKRQLLMLVCGLLMAGGFVAAAGQHFAAVRYGYTSEELRLKRARLLEEQQQLIMRINEATSPAELERAALEIGMQPARPSQIKRAAQQPTTTTTITQKTSASRPNAQKPPRTRSVAH